jgi:hypothetical protein
MGLHCICDLSALNFPDRIYIATQSKIAHIHFLYRLVGNEGCLLSEFPSFLPRQLLESSILFQSFIMQTASATGWLYGKSISVSRNILSNEAVNF